MVLAYLTFIAFQGRTADRLLEAPRPPPDAEIHYHPERKTGGKWKLRALLGVIAALALALLEMWDFERGRFDLFKVAIVGIPLLAALALRERRALRDRPAVAVYSDGLRLDSWRGETLVPWKDVEYVATDPAESTGYRPNTNLRLLIGRKGGREWRYFERDFGDEAQSGFDRICDLAQRHLQRPGS